MKTTLIFLVLLTINLFSQNLSTDKSQEIDARVDLEIVVYELNFALFDLLVDENLLSIAQLQNAKEILNSIPRNQKYSPLYVELLSFIKLNIDLANQIKIFMDIEKGFDIPWSKVHRYYLAFQPRVTQLIEDLGEQLSRLNAIYFNLNHRVSALNKIIEEKEFKQSIHNLYNGTELALQNRYKRLVELNKISSEIMSVK